MQEEHLRKCNTGGRQHHYLDQGCSPHESQGEMSRPLWRQSADAFDQVFVSHQDLFSAGYKQQIEFDHVLITVKLALLEH